MPLLQGCAVPFREGPAGREFLLITNRKGKWIFPKGVVRSDQTAWETAAREAFEEAGIRGTIARSPVGDYADEKWGRELCVEVFLLRVEEVLDEWEEDDERVRRWLDADGVRRTLRKKLRPIFDAALAALAEGDHDRVPSR